MSKSLDRESFRSLAQDRQIVPVWRELLADLTTPVAAYLRIVGTEQGFLLESVENHQRWGRQSFVGRRPLATLRSHGQKVELEVLPRLPPSSATSTPPDSVASFATSPASPATQWKFPKDSGIFAALESLTASLGAPQLPGLPSLCTGFVGYLGYDVVREIEHLENKPEDVLRLPDASLSLVGQVAAFDHWRQRVTLVENVLIPPDATEAMLDECYDQAITSLEEFARAGANHGGTAGANPASGLHSNSNNSNIEPLSSMEPLLPLPLDPEEPVEADSSLTVADYCLGVEAAREHILEGDIFQVVLSERFDFDLDAEPFDVYRVLRQINPSPYMYYLSLPEVTIAGSSPEPLVQVRDSKVTSRPIAGTRKRGRNAEEDARLAAELLEHPKERAEHVMLVDLARNDISRVIEYGTLNLEELMTLERYSHVMHMTSQVSGKLASGKTSVDVLKAVLPAGTVSGAPKVRAMEIIDSLEPASRGPYAGAVGYIDLSGNIDVAIAIRTMVIQGNRASVQAGAGIVADSIPDQEETECRNKARALLSAVTAARRMTAAREQASQ